jgi:hypothetical protein
LIKKILIRKALTEVARSLERDATMGILKSQNETEADFNEFISELHKIPLQTCVFNNIKNFSNFVERQLNGSLQVTAFIFHEPNEILKKVKYPKKSQISSFR